MNRIILGDNLDVLRTLPSESVDLIYIDPPFNTGKVQKREYIETVRDEDGDRTGFKGQRYRTEKVSEASFEDSFEDYWGFLDPRVREGYRVLKPNGSFYFHVDYREVHYCKVALDGIFGRSNFLNEVIWAYDYGAKTKSRWPAKHDNILVYVKNRADYVFNVDEVDRIPYMAPALAGPEKAARGKLPTDVWFHTIVSPTGKEKLGYPCLRPGSKVLTEIGWRPIESMREGLRVRAADGSFRPVSVVSRHLCSGPLVRLVVEGSSAVVDATLNHPFLVWRDGVVAWVVAGQLRAGDYSLSPLSVREEHGTLKPCEGLLGLGGSLPKGISSSELRTVGAGLSMSSCESEISVRYPMDFRSTIETTTSRTILCRTSNLSTPLHISGFTPVANCEMVFGGSHVGCAVCSNPRLKSTGTFQEVGSTVRSADPALSEKLLSSAAFALHRVVSAGVVPYNGEVWNLTVEGSPTFQTEIGMSHNTQKPLGVLRRIVRASCPKGGVVLDFFSGTGTSGMAALETGRRFVLVDKSQVAYAKMVDRFSAFRSEISFEPGA